MGLAGVGVRHADADRAAVVEPGHLVRVRVRARARVRVRASVRASARLGVRATARVRVRVIHLQVVDATRTRLAAVCE